MKDFSRVLQLVARRRWSIVGVVVTSLMIALLWGANIGTLYPMVEVVFQGESLPQYTKRTLKEVDSKIAELDTKIESLSSQLREVDDESGEQARNLRLQLQLAQDNRKLASESVDYLIWAKPAIDRYAPSTAFRTLMLILGVLLAGTTIKLLALARPQT